MFSVSSDLYNVIHQISRYLFPFLGLLVFLSALGWLFAERRSRRERLHNLPGTGTVGELVVLSGSRELKNMTWFPVPREGTLGSVRSCDLVVPCPGVKAQHLDFSWQDGLGLLIRPRSGCEAIVDGVALNCRSDAAARPLTHGSCLQVGTAVLRLQLFAALDHMDRSAAQAGEPEMNTPGPLSPVFPVPQSPEPYPQPNTVPAPPESVPVSPDPLPEASSECPAAPDPAPQAPRPRRSDRWKEDWSE